MSADNFYIVRNHPLGGFAAVMGFVSDVDAENEQIYPEVSITDQQFKTIGESLDWSVIRHSEYGVDVHPETCQKHK